MSSLRKSRLHHTGVPANARNRFRPLVEWLESRETPAGNVNVTFAAGVLNINAVDDLTGAGILAGNNNQQIVIQGTGAGSFDVTGEPGTKINGVDGGKFSKAGVTAINVNMKLGNDRVSVFGADLSGKLSIIGGAGNDEVRLGKNNVDTSTFGSVSIANGDGDDTVTGRGNLTVTGALNINNGIGNSNTTLGVDVTDTTTVGSLTITNTDGLDQLNVAGAKFTSKGAVLVNNGNGAGFIAGGSKSMFIADIVDFQAGVTINSGDGFDLLQVGTGSGIVTGKAFTINTGNGDSSTTFAMGGNTFIGNLLLSAGIGNEQITFNNMQVTGNLTINSGAGNNNMHFQSNAAISGNVLVTSALGHDNFDLENTVSSFVVGGSVTINNGAGSSSTDLATTNELSIGKLLSITNGNNWFQNTVIQGTNELTLHGVTIVNGLGGSSTTILGKNIESTGAISITSGDVGNKFSSNTVLFTGEKFKVVGAGISVKNGSGGSTTTFSSSTSIDVGGVTSITNGTGEDVITIGTGTTTSNLLGVSINSGAGDSNVTFNGTTTLATLSILNGDGSDTLNINDSFTANGAVTVNNGLGDSFTNFFGISNHMKSNLSITNLDGFDFITVMSTAFTVDGTTTIKFDDGDSHVFMHGTTHMLNGAFSVTAADGSDVVSFWNNTTAKGVLIDLGHGDNYVEFLGPTPLTGNLTVNSESGDDIFTNFDAFLSKSFALGVTGLVTIDMGTGNDQVTWNGTGNVVTGAVTIKTGDGADTITLAGWNAAGAVTLDTAAGNDIVRIDDSTFNGTVAVNTGAGIDQLLIENQDTGASTTFNKTFTAKMGDGDDVIDVGRAGDANDFAQFLAAAAFDGGIGLDMLTTALGGRSNIFAVPLTTPLTEVIQ